MNRIFPKISLLLICTCTPLSAGAEENADVQNEAAIAPATPNGETTPQPPAPVAPAEIVKLPDQIEVQPTKIIHTSETQLETVIIDHIREHHIMAGRPPVYVDRYIVRTTDG